eukprot:364023-Chlamydomonas_euryale.AAC.5
MRLGQRRLLPRRPWCARGWVRDHGPWRRAASPTHQSGVPMQAHSGWPGERLDHDRLLAAAAAEHAKSQL